ncbi:hypothetical protein C8R44DRAFT_813165 [Mycena epipterygia]|nr:hypothetical protein C8R44DRAFT_813165 [Mycena epipterygia]
MDAQNSAASRVLSILELYELLLVFVAQGSYNRRDERSLAQLARVCKTTSGPALDLLWANLASPAQLIDLLPEDAVIKGTHRAAQWALRRPLFESDFAVFDKYAPRVQCVDFGSSFTSMAGGCELFATLKSFRDPILPRLVDFQWHPSPRFNTLGAFHLISRGVPRERFSLTMWNPVDMSEVRGQAPIEFTTAVGLAETVALFNQPLSTWLPDVQRLEFHTGKFLTRPVILDGLKHQTDLRQFYSSLPLGE